MEEMVPELEDLERRGYFSKPELRKIVAKREAFEYALKRRACLKSDFLRYAKHEMDLDRLRRLRKRTRSINGKASLADHCLGRRVHFVFERATRKFRGDLGLWSQWLAWCRESGAKRQMSRVLVRALRIHPRVPGLWARAAAWQANQCGDPAAARALLQQGLRLCPDAVGLWSEYVAFELSFAARLRARRIALGLPVTAPTGGAGNNGNNDDGVNAGPSTSEADRAAFDVLGGGVARAALEAALAALPATAASLRELGRALEPFERWGARAVRRAGRGTRGMEGAADAPLTLVAGMRRTLRDALEELGRDPVEGPAARVAAADGDGDAALDPSGSAARQRSAGRIAEAKSLAAACVELSTARMADAAARRVLGGAADGSADDAEGAGGNGPLLDEALDDDDGPGAGACLDALRAAHEAACSAAATGDGGGGGGDGGTADGDAALQAWPRALARSGRLDEATAAAEAAVAARAEGGGRTAPSLAAGAAGLAATARHGRGAPSGLDGAAAAVPPAAVDDRSLGEAWLARLVLLAASGAGLPKGDEDALVARLSVAPATHDPDRADAAGAAAVAAVALSAQGPRGSPAAADALEARLLALPRPGAPLYRSALARAASRHAAARPGTPARARAASAVSSLYRSACAIHGRRDDGLWRGWLAWCRRHDPAAAPDIERAAARGLSRGLAGRFVQDGGGRGGGDEDA